MEQQIASLITKELFQSCLPSLNCEWELLKIENDPSMTDIGDLLENNDPFILGTILSKLDEEVKNNSNMKQ